MFEQLLPELTQWLQQKLENFKDGCISIKIKEWTKVTPDPEILLTVKKLTLEFLKEPSINNVRTNNKVGMKSGQNSPHIMLEVKKLLKRALL